MITQCNTKLFFWISDLKILRWKILLRVKSDPLLLSLALTCVPRVRGQSPPTICCQPSPPSDLQPSLWGKISVYWCKWGGHWWQTSSKQGSIRDLSLETGGYLSHQRETEIFIIEFQSLTVSWCLQSSPSVDSFLDNLGWELSQNHVTIFGKLN